MKFNERFKEWVKNNNIKQIDIANKLDVNKSYISNVISGRVPPSEKLIEELVNMSGKSSTWWLFGVDKYDNLHSLNEMINILIDNQDIKENGFISDDVWNILKSILVKEINVKLDNKYPDRKKRQE